MESLVFDLEGWPQLSVMTFDLAGSQMADYSVFPVANRRAAFCLTFSFCNCFSHTYMKDCVLKGIVK
jgi:hypothetical protein